MQNIKTGIKSQIVEILIVNINLEDNPEFVLKIEMKMYLGTKLILNKNTKMICLIL